MSYSPLRAVLAWHLLAAMLIVLLTVDLTAGSAPVTIEVPTASMNPADGSPGASWVSGFIERSAADPFRLCMIGSFLALFGFGLTQLAALRLETGLAQRSAERRPSGRLGGLALAVLARLSGRPAAFFTQPPPPDHVGRGHTVLLLTLRQGTPLFPAVGFMGTVVGISQAIRVLPAVKQSDNLAPLIDGLYVAFDTTLLGLIALGVLTALQIVIESQRERAAAAIEAAGACDGFENRNHDVWP